MIRLTKDILARWLESLLHIHDSPQRTAAAYALGVFFGFSPFLGLHTVLGLICAFALNLNRVAVVAGVYSNLPWIIAPYYALATALGAALLRAQLPPDLGQRFQQLFALSILDAAFWTDLLALTRPFIWPYVVGSTLGALALAWIAYRVTFAFIEARRRHRARKPDTPPA